VGLILSVVFGTLIGVMVKREIDKTYVNTVNTLKAAIPDYVSTSSLPALPWPPNVKREIVQYIMDTATGAEDDDKKSNKYF
jgi:hypothetical protein